MFDFFSETKMIWCYLITPSTCIFADEAVCERYFWDNISVHIDHFISKRILIWARIICCWLFNCNCGVTLVNCCWCKEIKLWRNIESGCKVSMVVLEYNQTYVSILNVNEWIWVKWRTTCFWLENHCERSESCFRVKYLLSKSFTSEISPLENVLSYV